jgi:transposase
MKIPQHPEQVVLTPTLEIRGGPTPVQGKDVEEINELKRGGLSILKISEMTGYDRKTIRKYLLNPDVRPVYGPRPKPASKLAAFEPYPGARLQAGVWNARVLLRELRERGYTGGYTVLTDWLRPQRTSAGAAAVRQFETPPGSRRRWIGGAAAR